MSASQAIDLNESLTELANANREIAELRSRLAHETNARRTLQCALDLRNAALDAATTHFMIVDARCEQRTIVYANRALAVQHGFERADDLIGKSAAALLGAQAFVDQRDALAMFAQRSVVRYEAELERRDGSRFWAGFCTSALRDSQGAITHYVTLGADISARLAAEREERELRERLYSEMRERERIAIELRLAHKLESIGRMAAGLAHEINTPIQYVGDSVHFLRSAFHDLEKLFLAYREAALHPLRASPEAARARFEELEHEADFEFLRLEVPRAIERTLEGADRVASIVRAMKEFSHPDAGEQAPADLNQALATTLIVTHNEYKYAAAVATQLGELPDVTCNIGELNQVFVNLIVNAAHAIADAGKDARSGQITIGTRRHDTQVEIVVADNGCGISPDNLEKVFDPFFTTKEVGRGTGQGLSLARSIIVDRHGGTIDVHSEIGIGTRFVLRLPIHGKP